MSLASRLKKILKEKSLTQKQAAEIIGISAQSLNYIITNDLKTSKLAPKISMNLGIHLDWLLYGKGRPMEPTYYEVPVFNNSFCLEKFLEDDESQGNSTEYTVIDHNLGSKSFAYLLSKKELIFCYSSASVEKSNLYLCIDFLENIVELCEKPKGKSPFPVYAILEKYWRI